MDPDRFPPTGGPYLSFVSRPASPPPSGAHRLPLAFVLATLVIDAMGIGLILPVMPDLIREVNGGSLAQAAVWGGILATAFAVRGRLRKSFPEASARPRWPRFRRSSAG